MGASLECQLERVAAGDVAAFSAVYDATSPWVFGLVVRVLVDREQAAQVVREVFAEAWRCAGHFDPRRGSAVDWLLIMAHGRAVDRVRATRAQRDRDAGEAAREPKMARVSPCEQVAELASGVRDALRRLSEVQREAIMLAYLGGMTHTEIADHLCVPLGAVNARLRDGMNALSALAYEARVRAAADA